MTATDCFPQLCIVIPCYNEERVLPESYALFLGELHTLLEKNLISPNSKIMFVDDGSTDSTWNIIKRLSFEHEEICGLRLSRNRGHQNALLAGIMTAMDYFDITISVDCDGQDDVSAMTTMIEKYLDGYDIVYGVRSDRSSDNAFKRATAVGFYRLLNAFGVESVFNHADYRLMSKRALQALSQFKEKNLYLRGLVPLVGFPSTTVEYSRAERLAGESHYPLTKMVELAINGISSMSIKPIRLITGLGLLVTLLSIIGIIWTIATFFSGASLTGWSSTMIVILFMGGVQIFSIGIIGEYIGKVYTEVKGRPSFTISEFTGKTLDSGENPST